MAGRDHIDVQPTPATPLSIDHRHLLDLLAATPTSDRLSWIELATVTHLLRPVPWASDNAVTSVLTSRHHALAVRAARTMHSIDGVCVARALPTHRRDSQARYDVLVPTATMPEVQEWLDGLWDAATKQVGPESEDDRRAAAARTMWRAAVLVSSSNRRRRQIRVSVPSAMAMEALNEAARALGLRAVRLGRDRHRVVVIDEPDGSIHLLRAIGGGPFADAWVRGSR